MYLAFETGWEYYTNVFSFHVPWFVSLLLLAAFYAMSWPDINNSRLYQYVGFEEAHKFWRDSNGYFKYKANLYATAIGGVACFIVALAWFSPLMIGLPAVCGTLRLIYAITKTGKDIKFRSQKQKDFLASLSTVADSSDDGLAIFFSTIGNYSSFDWGTSGDQILQKGDRWVYGLFPAFYSTNTDANAAHIELRRDLYNLSQKSPDQWYAY